MTPEQQAQSIIDQWFIDSGDVDSSFSWRIDLRRRVAVALTAERDALEAEVARLRVVNRVLGRLVHQEYGNESLAEIAFLYDGSLTDEEEAVMRAMEVGNE